MRSLSTVLFDLDGTLTDSRAGITACIRHALDRLGHACPDEEALAIYMGPPPPGPRWARRRAPAPTATEAAVGHYRPRYEAVGLFENRVYDAVPAMLDAIARRGHPLAVATAKMRHTATPHGETFAPGG